MCLGHVYIVLEPIGSTRLTLGDYQYYEFMCFDVPMIVRNPGCDHGHDEESQNGRDIKIDILDGYIWTPERFRVIRVFFGVPESYGNSPGSIWALLGHTGIEERGRKEGGAPPPSPCPIRTGGEGRAALPWPPLLSST